MRIFNRSIFIPIAIIVALFIWKFAIERSEANSPSVPVPITSETVKLKQQEESITCPIEINVGEYAEFIDSGNEVPIIGKPVLVPSPTVVKQSKSFIDRKKEIMEMIANEDDGETEDGTLGVFESGKLDIDADGKEETLMTADLYMNHRPHMVILVKDGNVIFEARGGGIWIEKVYGNKGFLLSQEENRLIGEYTNTRYVPKDGGFVPIWTQKTCYAQFTK